MVNIPKKPEDFYWESGKGDLRKALQFLIDTKNYVANLEVPKEFSHYRQIAHSGDKTAPGEDPSRPAVLNASYKHMGGNRVSFSFPIFTPAEWPARQLPYEPTFRDKFRNLVDRNFSMPKYGDVVVNTGFNAGTIQEAFLILLDSYRIRYESGSTKLGYYEPEMTSYIETTVDDPAEHERGRRLMQVLAHSKAETPEQLFKEMNQALPPNQRPNISLN